jgi:UDP-N-acetyl-D-mannosaminuronic acid dehydrogenase
VALADAVAQADVICVLVRHSAFGGLRDRLPEGARLVDVVGLP